MGGGWLFMFERRIARLGFEEVIRVGTETWGFSFKCMNQWAQLHCYGFNPRLNQGCHQHGKRFSTPLDNFLEEAKLENQGASYRCQIADTSCVRLNRKPVLIRPSHL